MKLKELVINYENLIPYLNFEDFVNTATFLNLLNISIKYDEIYIKNDTHIVLLFNNSIHFNYLKLKLKLSIITQPLDLSICVRSLKIRRCKLYDNIPPAG